MSALTTFIINGYFLPKIVEPAIMAVEPFVSGLLVTDLEEALSTQLDLNQKVIEPPPPKKVETKKQNKSTSTVISQLAKQAFTYGSSFTYIEYVPTFLSPINAVEIKMIGYICRTLLALMQIQTNSSRFQSASSIKNRLFIILNTTSHTSLALTSLKELALIIAPEQAQDLFEREFYYLKAFNTGTFAISYLSKIR